MKKAGRILLGMAGLFMLLTGIAVAEQKDDKGCKDHPLFTRMPGSWIHSCKEQAFNAHKFNVGNGKFEEVEGRFWKINYYPQANQEKPSELQILRNFENAVTKLGGSVMAKDKSRQWMRIDKDGKEFWVDLSAEFTGKYGFTIIEKQAMAQDIVANAEVFSNDIRSTGHVAVYGIYFDSGKSVVKPESDVALAEIAKLLKGDPGLKLNVVGHTDNVGQMDYNMKLSQARAEAVAQALVAKHGISAARLKGYGVASLAPVTSNEAEEGRAKNRRVELVKQ